MLTELANLVTFLTKNVNESEIDIVPKREIYKLEKVTMEKFDRELLDNGKWFDITSRVFLGKTSDNNWYIFSVVTDDLSDVSVIDVNNPNVVMKMTYDEQGFFQEHNNEENDIEIDEIYYTKYRQNEINYDEELNKDNLKRENYFINGLEYLILPYFEINSDYINIANKRLDDIENDIENDIDNN